VLFPRPRSLGGLIFLGLLLVSLPLLGGVVSAALEISRLADSSERLVLHGIQATRYTQALVRQVAAMERSARLYQLLGRPQLRGVFDENHRRMQAVLDGLAVLPSEPARDALVAGIRARAQDIAHRLGSQDAGPRAAALGEFGALSQDTGRLSLLASQQIDRELEGVRAETERTRRRLLWQTAALIPISIGAAFTFALLLGRPLRDIDVAIANLGNGRLDQPVSVRGPPTDLEALGRQIEWLRRRLLEVAEERERFLRHVSHELKTPLANIREGSELLLEGAVGSLRPEQREIAGILRENGLQLQQLIENLLSYSEWQTKRGGLELSQFQLKPLIDSVIESYQLRVAARRLRLAVDVDDLVLDADRNKLKLILDNLLSNAVKFSPAGGVVGLAAHAEGDELVLDVTDEGPGVAPTDRGRIFEPFFQGATPQDGLVRGTGIGLSVVQEFARAHGGNIELVEGGGRGSRFRLRLPMGRSGVGDAAQAVAQAVESQV
jgi:two-component system sensor histidine kinase GlrK